MEKHIIRRTVRYSIPGSAGTLVLFHERVSRIKAIRFTNQSRFSSSLYRA